MTSASPLPIPATDPRPLHGQSAYDALREEIRSGQLRPGTRLTETEVAARLQISRTPVREAIRRLEAEGLVEHQPRTGAVIRQLDYSEIMELYEMRCVFESTAARLAARAASDIEIAELREINRDMEAAIATPDRMATLNRLFHRRLLDAARNRFLHSSMASVETTMLILGPTSMESRDRAQAAIGEHDAVIDALSARDGETAERLMRQHMEGAQSERLRMLRDRAGEGTAS